jgi:hypothetical protein
VTVDGKPFTLPSDARGTVVFQPDGGHGTMATGLLNSTGHFQLATGSSSEIAQGKYYVTVTVSQLLQKTESEEQGAKLITPARYSSPNDSGLTADVRAGENQITLNLDSKADDKGQDATVSTPDPQTKDTAKP